MPARGCPTAYSNRVWPGFRRRFPVCSFRAFGHSQAYGTTTLIGSGMTQVEEVSTLWKIRYAVLEAHLGFSLADALSNSKESPPETPSA